MMHGPANVKPHKYFIKIFYLKIFIKIFIKIFYLKIFIKIFIK